MNPKPQVLEVWGDFACFTRPELKVERFSYPIMTPSAARGIFDAIYCKPNKDPTQAQFRWRIRKIEMLEPVAYIALRRNEVKEKVNLAAVARWMTGDEAPTPIFADGDRDLLGTDEKGRTQRQTMALKNVRYRLTAVIRPYPGHENKQQSLESQFRRRASFGKCFHQPCLGCREFPAYFELRENGDDLREPVRYSQDLGLMLYDVFDLRCPGTALMEGQRPFISLFRAMIKGGALEVPEFESPAVLKPEAEVPDA
ncbi:MAG: type I-C CRISPR-associated protein Cas5c [Candidatus Sumerlaeota bacterium]|nr:type I-C CRISPR-associated protein Cas5c [Candidatus Sumerlaeota bacterium]